MGHKKKICEEKINEVKEMFELRTNYIKSKIKGKDNRNEIKPLVTARILFYTIIDKIYLGFLILLFLYVTVKSFLGDVTSIEYNYFDRLLSYGMDLILIIILYFIFNWIYKCIIKSMLCLTNKEIYGEQYIPFVRTEISIPIEKVTKVDTVDILWIFRLLIIHQYHAFPVFMWTWNNHEFKNKLDELIASNDSKIVNDYENNNIIPKSWNKYLLYVVLGIVVVVFLVGMVRLYGYITSPARNVYGTYYYEKSQLVLKDDATCVSKLFFKEDKDSKTSNCKWEYNEDEKLVIVTYDYEVEGWYSSYNLSNTVELEYNTKDKTITYGSNVYSKKK